VPVTIFEAENAFDHDTISILRVGDQWCVLFSERGWTKVQYVTDDEGDACRYFAFQSARVGRDGLTGWLYRLGHR
jgi:hypothetical protein